MAFHSAQTFVTRLIGLLIASMALIALAPAQAHAEEPKTVPLLMIVVGFDGGGNAAKATPYDELYDWAQPLFADDESLAAYYLDMSEGSFTFSPARETSAYDAKTNVNIADRADDGVVHITLATEHGVWGMVNDDDSVTQEFGKTVLEVFRQTARYVDYSSYDANGNGMVTPDELAIVICVAGYDASPFENPGRTDVPAIWPHAGKLANNGNDEEMVDGVRVDSYIAVAEYLNPTPEKREGSQQEPLGILYHELGHYLGLPDLYALNKNPSDALWGAYKVGILSIMDTGLWAQAGNDSEANEINYQPTGFDAWSRYVLNWGNTQIATESGEYRLTSERSDDGYSQLLVPTPSPNQFYLLEIRLPESWDSAISEEFADGNPRGGIVIWHINKDIYRQFGADNEANNTGHAPAVMELFFESQDDRYTTDWTVGYPVSNQVFYDSASCDANLGSSSASIDLPLYSGADGGKPSSRRPSGITVEFPTEAAREMTVRVNLGSGIAGTASRSYPLDEEEREKLRTGESQLGKIACAALIDETGANISVIDAQSVLSGLPSDGITYANAYGMLPSDSNIVCYNLTGSQLIELIEQSLNVSDERRRVLSALEALGSFTFIDALPNDVDGKVPTANAALSFGNISYDADWNGVPGVRTSNVMIGDKPIDLEAEYYVAMTATVAGQYALFDNLSPDTTVIWGTPADALRSFVEYDDWEQVALG